MLQPCRVKFDVREYSSFLLGDEIVSGIIPPLLLLQWTSCAAGPLHLHYIPHKIQARDLNYKKNTEENQATSLVQQASRALSAATILDLAVNVSHSEFPDTCVPLEEKKLCLHGRIRLFLYELTRTQPTTSDPPFVV